LVFAAKCKAQISIASFVTKGLRPRRMTVEETETQPQGVEVRRKLSWVYLAIINIQLEKKHKTPQLVWLRLHNWF